MFALFGLPEGIVGRSRVEAASVEDLFARYPALAEVRDKLVIVGQEIRGFCPCDG